MCLCLQGTPADKSPFPWSQRPNSAPRRPRWAKLPSRGPCPGPRGPELPTRHSGARGAVQGHWADPQPQHQTRRPSPLARRSENRVFIWGDDFPCFKVRGMMTQGKGRWVQGGKSRLGHSL